MTAFSDEELARLSKNAQHDISDLARELLQLRRQITPQAVEAEDGRYSLGLCADGCAILYDGVPVTVDDVIRRLNRTAPPQAGEAEPAYYAVVDEEGDVIQLTKDKQYAHDFINDAIASAMEQDITLANRWVVRPLYRTAPPRPVGPTNSEAMKALRYLMQQFDSERSYCSRCGHADSTSDTDSAIWLREWLAAHPPSPVAPVWLPLINIGDRNALMLEANELGLSMADDLLRRLREGQS